MNAHAQFAQVYRSARARMEAAARARNIADPEAVCRRLDDLPKAVLVGERAEAQAQKDAEAAAAEAAKQEAAAAEAAARATADLFTELLSTVEIIASTSPTRVKLADVRAAAAYVLAVSDMDLISQRRSAAVARARQIAMYVCKMLTPASLPRIGAAFGGRDHSTVRHAVDKIAAAIPSDDALSGDVDKVRVTAIALASGEPSIRARLKAGRAAA